MLLPSALDTKEFSSFNKVDGWVDHYAVAWDVDNKIAEPVLYPTPAKSSRIFLTAGMNVYRELKTGIVLSKGNLY